MIGRIQKGQIITAGFLNDMAGGVDDLTREFASRPKQVLQASPAEVQNEAAEGDDEVTDPSVYIEQSRTTSSVTVYDQNEENYAEVDRIETVTLQNELGETLVLQFNNSG